MLRAYGVDLVLDVGANVGQFARSLIDVGWTGRIVSFEPMSEPYAALQRASARHPQWEIAERCCIGDHNGEIELHASEDSVASSVLPLSSNLVSQAFIDADTGRWLQADVIAFRTNA